MSKEQALQFGTYVTCQNTFLGKTKEERDWSGECAQLVLLLKPETPIRSLSKRLEKT